MKAIHLLTALLSSLVGFVPTAASPSSSLVASRSPSSTTLLLLLLFPPAAVVVVVSAQEAQEGDDVAECVDWASIGECSLNPRYMLETCPVACGRRADLDREMAAKIGESRPRAPARRNAIVAIGMETRTSSNVAA